MSAGPDGPVEPDAAVGAVDDVDAVDAALAAAVLEIEQHVGADGWDRPARLYALVDTAQLVQAQPDLVGAMGLDEDPAPGSLTPVEQDGLHPDQTLESQLEQIAWPPSVLGCAAVVERLVLPPGADDDLPDEPGAQVQYAGEHPDRQEVRMVAAATRRGTTYCALRLRSHDDPASVAGGTDLVPGLLALLRETLSDDLTDDPHDDPQEENPS